jgi:Tfp pilus assembly protein PilX
MNTATRPTSRPRRGTVLAVVVLLLAAINVTTLTVLYGTGDDAAISALRIETVRALYAAESGTLAVMKLRERRATLPAAGTTLSLPNSVATYEQVPGPTATTGSLIVRGASGDASRRVRLDFDVR